MLKVTYFNRDKRLGNFSIEELFVTIRSGMKDQIVMSDYQYNSGLGRLRSIKEAGRYQGDVNHITGDVNFLAYGLNANKTILTVHDVGHYENTLKGWKKFIYRYIWFQWPLNRVKKITTISAFTKQQLIKYFNIPETKIKVIHNPCPSGFTYTPKDFNVVRPRILQIGPGRNKNIHRLVESIKGISCELMLIRKPDEALRKILDENHIQYQWFSDLTYAEVIEKYKECDLLFFASEYEGFGMPILEANATGRPVITGNVSAMPEVAGEAACIVDPFSVESIRAGILKVIQEKTYREELIAKGLKNVKRFDQASITRQYLELYHSIANV